MEQPQQFLQSYRCECFQPYNYCNCPYKSIAADILLANVREMALTLIKVMELCGIAWRKAKLSLAVVIHYFLHFEEIRTRIDVIPRKYLFKQDLLHDLGRKCGMQRTEVQIAYTIIKRAFRAFYHGTGEGGVPNPLLGQQLIHAPECMWAHAAKRTAEIYAAYEGMFMVQQKDVECKIKVLYKELYERLKSTQQPDENHECACATCGKRIMREGLRTAKVTICMHGGEDAYEKMYRSIVDKMLEDSGGKDNMKDKNCTCPTLEISDKDLEYTKIAVACNTGYSQGPYACHWFSVDEDEYKADDKGFLYELPEEFNYTSGLQDDRSSRVSDCQCSSEVCSSEAEPEANDIGEEEEENNLNGEEDNISGDSSIKKGFEINEKEFGLRYGDCKFPPASKDLNNTRFTSNGHRHVGTEQV